MWRQASGPNISEDGNLHLTPDARIFEYLGFTSDYSSNLGNWGQKIIKKRLAMTKLNREAAAIIVRRASDLDFSLIIYVSPYRVPRPRYQRTL